MTTIDYERLRGAELQEGDSLIINDTPHKIGGLSQGRGVPGMRLVMFPGPISSGGGGREVYVHNDQFVYIVPRSKPAYPAGTLIQSGGIIMVRTGEKDKWVRVTDKSDRDHTTGWSDRDVRQAIEVDKTLDLLFTPDTKDA